MKIGLRWTYLGRVGDEFLLVVLPVHPAPDPVPVGSVLERGIPSPVLPKQQYKNCCMSAQKKLEDYLSHYKADLRYFDWSS